MTVLPDARSVLTVAAHVDARRRRLTPAEQRVASMLIEDPEVVAFSTVATIAERFDTSTGTVARLAAKVGYDGFPALQRAVRRELVQQTASTGVTADGRVRQALSAALTGEQAIVERALLQVDSSALHTAGRMLARRTDGSSRVRVRVLAGDAPLGVAVVFASRLSTLRAEVEVTDRLDVYRFDTSRQATWPDVIVAFDAAPHDDRLRDVVLDAADRVGCGIIAITDETSPIAEIAPSAFAVPTSFGEGRTTYVGMVALVNALLYEAGVQAMDT